MSTKACTDISSLFSYSFFPLIFLLFSSPIVRTLRLTSISGIFRAETKMRHLVDIGDRTVTPLVN